jgi:hypothetical protein
MGEGSVGEANVRIKDLNCILLDIAMYRVFILFSLLFYTTVRSPLVNSQHALIQQ